MCPWLKTKGFLKLEGTKDNSVDKALNARELHSSKPCPLANPIKEAHVDFEEAQWCPQLDQTATNEAQMIGEMIG
ncbi:hypothetical protein Tco_0013901 [Tanacetum coccineum]